MHNNLLKFLSKIFIAATFAVLLQLNSLYSQPLSAKFYTNALDVNVGDTIFLQLKINPNQDKPIYTVSATLMYDPGILQYEESAFADSQSMLPVPRDPYYLIDTENGMIRRTAGYANGTNVLSGFTTYRFKALKPGDTKITIEDGVALDENNQDIGLQQKELTIHIHDVEVAAESEATSSKVVEHTVKLNLEILGPIAIYKEQSYSFPVDQILSENSTDQKVKIYVYNDKAEIYYTDEKIIKPLLEEPISFTIPANTLDVGNYIISAELIQPDGNKEIITQKQIGVLSDNLNWVLRSKSWVLPIFFFIVIVALIHHIAVDRDLYERLKELRPRKRKTSNR